MLTASKLIIACRTMLLAISVILLASNAASQPADLGTFGSHNDIPNGIATYTLPAEDRMMADFVLAFINYTFTNGDGKVVSISEDKAKYGEGQIKNVAGVIVHVTSEFNHDDHSACTHDIRGTNGTDLPHGTPWIALIKRGNCTFEEKVRHAYSKRAVGVIIYNDKESGLLDKMKILDKESKCLNIFYSILFPKHKHLSHVITFNYYISDSILC